ncbi:CopG family transcriptional regulator [Sulfurimonas sp.]|jgi:metal-responsive CopG/Arc/MetJ family transcriptional regulator|uniref:CopG family transcriptional regulator n=1 Tax=Sulfurimonas sp. TaxID=2022749 RepID=UPI0025DB8065|nr:CopG family transcriptional regulator [Sulfurimonas sp.]MBT5935142.1 CopG family transcriptional regulator [Sulfurimonas sp.]
MVATVRLDENLTTTLNKVSKILHKKKSDVIREAIKYYALNVEKGAKSRMLTAIGKTKEIDKKDFKDFEGTFDDGI